MLEGIDQNEVMWKRNNTLFELRLSGMELGIIIDALNSFHQENRNNIEEYFVRLIGRKIFEVAR